MTGNLPDVYDSVDGYSVERVIARGGQAVVYEVRDEWGRPWALKVYRPGPPNEGHARRRAEREAREVAKRLAPASRRANLVVGEDYGVWRSTNYVKMKLLRGETLNDRLCREGRLTIRETLQFGVDLAEALAGAHRVGVIHRDVKPENVFLDDAGAAHLLDWGSMQVLDVGQTKTARRYGTTCTTGYAPIEQFTVQLARQITPAADLYALGVVLYEAIAGYHPLLSWWRGPLPAERQGEGLLVRLRNRIEDYRFRNAPTLQKRLLEVMPWRCAQPRRAVRSTPSLLDLYQLQRAVTPRPLPTLSRAFNHLLLSMLAASATDRPQSAMEVSMALRRELAREGTLARKAPSCVHSNARYVNSRLGANR